MTKEVKARCEKCNEISETKLHHSFIFGFPGIICPKCKHYTKYPLAKWRRFFYYYLIVSGGLTSILYIFVFPGIPIPILSFAAIYAILL